MIDPISATAAAISVGSGLLGFGSSRSAAKKARKLREQQLALHDMESAENIRRQQIEQGRAMSEDRALTYASNLMPTGTAARYMQARRDQFASDLSYERIRQQVQRKVIRYGGKATESQIRSAGVSSLLGAASTAVSAFAPRASTAPSGDTTG